MNGLDEWPTSRGRALRRVRRARGRRQVAARARRCRAARTRASPPRRIAATRVYAETPDWNEQRAAGDTTFADSEGWEDTLQTIIDLNDGGCFQPGAEGGGFDAITNGLSQGTSVGSFIPSGSGGRDRDGRAAGGRLQGAALPGRRRRRPVHHRELELHDLDQRRVREEGRRRGRSWSGWRRRRRRRSTTRHPACCPSRRTRTSTSATRSTRPSSTCSPRARTRRCRTTSGRTPSVYEALQVGVQGLLTGQKTVDQVLADMDAAWGRVTDGSRPGLAARAARTPLTTTYEHEDIMTATMYSETEALIVPKRRPPRPSTRRRTAPPRPAEVRPLVVGPARASSSSSRSTTSRPRSAASSPSPTGRASATSAGSGSTTSSRSSRTRRRSAPLTNTLFLAFASVILSNVAGLALALGLNRGLKSRYVAARPVLHAGGAEPAGGRRTSGSSSSTSTVRINGVLRAIGLERVRQGRGSPTRPGPSGPS